MSVPVRRHAIEGPICPWCDYPYTPGDASMMPEAITTDDEFFENCVRCHKSFKISRTINVLYLSYAIEKEKPS
jgi:hypothetical protein